uniref:DNA polymerase subunit gamma-1 n=2 Tax=Daphnia similis TaxID=35528 RepID=A0A4Y7N2X1_9CRUS|nr:EOG090X00SQ [Daphnia similis]
MLAKDPTLVIQKNIGQEFSSKNYCVTDDSSTESPSSNQNIINPCGIQMLPRSIHRQIFSKNNTNTISSETVMKIQEHLSIHKLHGKLVCSLPDIDLKLPGLQGQNIAEHFKRIADKQCGNYLMKLLDFLSHGIPDIPNVWNFSPGWTKYSISGETYQVDFPDEEAYVFDVEVCVKEGHLPTLATAVSKNCWYSWCSTQLFEEKKVQDSILKTMGSIYELKDLINLESKREQDRLILKDQKERIIVGHNVSYDRSRIKEQYFIEGTKVRFLDTMSLHIAISGITSFQRNMLIAAKSGTNDKPLKNQKMRSKSGKMEEILEWQNISSFNGLSDVHKLYCGGLGLDKEKRDIFVTGTLSDIKEDFQQLATYCARDCQATYEVLCVLIPEYQKRFPHPVTLAGMLEMSTAYLPVNRNWQRYLQDSEDAYRDLENELTQSLKREADRAAHMITDKAYEGDPWLWNLDWSTKPLKVKKAASHGKKKKKAANGVPSMVVNGEGEDQINEDEAGSAKNEIKRLQQKFQELFDTKDHLFKRNSFLPGYPNWYCSLCDRAQDGLVGPSEVSTSAQVVPKLLKLTWDGYPLFHSRELGWGYLVPGRPFDLSRRDENIMPFPLKEAFSLFPPRIANQNVSTQGIITAEEALVQLGQMTDLSADPLELAFHWQSLQAIRRGSNNRMERQKDSFPAGDQSQKKHSNYLTSDRPAWHLGIGPYDVGIPGCWFFRLPHKSGVDNNVGNPLAKDYLNKIEDGTLKATSSSIAEHILKLNRNIIYWKNARDRVISQMVVWLRQSQLPRNVTNSDNFDPSNRYGAILPQIITSGTLTRRAVESTWLTASNAYKDRLGSELKAMIQCPPGFNFVGADVDSQELWIASIIGDSYFAGQHGSTAFGWMTLQGKKSDGTDMHSRTALAVDITRDQAKVLNYGRIYGAGERFAKTLLMQFNHRLTEKEAAEKARKMYSMTKGNSVFKLNSRGRKLASALGYPLDETVTPEQLNNIRKNAKKEINLAHLARLPTEDLVERRMWSGGTESHMFNKLEEIAQSQAPETPVLHCRISRALEPCNVGNEFMTSRVNWVVQSSAVDYLHLMIVAMRYLLDVYKIEGRFSISIHDEVRYIIKEEDKFRAALALQIANLWTRCMFSYQMNLYDLPQAVAFFSSVDIDKVLRKETNIDCQTPSNPYGLKQGYRIDFGCSYDIYQILEKTGGSLDSNR